MLVPHKSAELQLLALHPSALSALLLVPLLPALVLQLALVLVRPMGMTLLLVPRLVAAKLEQVLEGAPLLAVHDPCRICILPNVCVVEFLC